MTTSTVQRTVEYPYPCPAPQTPADIRAEDLGAVVLLHPLTSAGREWLEKSGGMWCGDSLVIEPGFVAALAGAARKQGLVVS